MRVIGEDNRKTSSKFYGNDNFNPTYIYTGSMRHSSIEREGLVELDFRPIIELNFRLENLYGVSSGLQLSVADIDNDKYYYILNDDVFKIFDSIVKNDGLAILCPETQSVRVPFSVVKQGSKVKLEVYTEGDMVR